MPCGVTITPLPKFASTLPVWRSNLKIGSTGLFSQSTGPPPAVPAPQRSYAQTCPSLGSMSSPAEVPHFRPAGSSPQFLVTLGAGFSSPSPVMEFATFPAPCADKVVVPPEWPYAIDTAQATTAASRILSVDMTPPRDRIVKS